MRNIHGRMLFILLVGVWLVSLASTGAIAGLGLGSSPNNATVNSVWNISATWQNGDGIWPTLEAIVRTEGLNDMSRIGTVRPALPAKWADTMTWMPVMPPPDGFVGFPEPPDIDLDSNGLPVETYQDPGYVTLQPDPVSMGLEAPGDPAYGHGVDYIGDESDALEDAAEPGVMHPGISVSGSSQPEVPAPLPSGWLQQCVVPQQDEQQADAGTGFPGRPKTPAVIVTAKVPLLLAGVWSVGSVDGVHSVSKQIKARIRNARDIYPADPTKGITGWPQYDVIEIMEEDGKLPGNATRLFVCYYAPGTKYVITQQSPLPMPYTVYQAQIADDSAPYLMINDGILRLDPNRVGADLNSPTLTQDQCPILGVYRTPQLWAAPGAAGTNYFDLTVPPPAAPAVRYEDPNYPGANNPFGPPLHPNYGNLFLTNPDPTALTTGTTYYIVVSTNAVDGVYDARSTLGTNYYLKPKAAPEDPDEVYGYCSKSGIIRLGTPLDTALLTPDPNTGAILAGPRLWVKYRSLSNSTFTVGQAGRPAYVENIKPIAPANDTWAITPKDVAADLGGGKIAIDNQTKLLPYGTYGARVSYRAIYRDWGGNGAGPGVVWYRGSIPMRWDPQIGLGPIDGAVYRVAVSAGLNMMFTDTNGRQPQRPWRDESRNLSYLNNKLIYDPRGLPMYPDGLTTIGGGPTTRWLTCVGYGVAADRTLIANAVTVQNNVTVTVHGSSAGRTTNRNPINYGGGGNNDWLTCYSNGSLPYGSDVDPLAVEPIGEAINKFPDDGSGSTMFVFRVRYHNDDGMPPLPWLPDGSRGYPFNVNADLWQGAPSGVVLYLDEQGTGDFKPHFMHPDMEQNSLGINAAGVNVMDVYTYRVIPHNAWVGHRDAGGGAWIWPHQEGANSRLYQSLSMGTYHYFFACSDDSLKFDDGSFPFEHQYNGKMDPASDLTALEEWGQTVPLNEYSSTGLDPSLGRAVTDYKDVDRLRYRRYSSDGTLPFDDTIYVDREVRVPGEFEPAPPMNYTQSAVQHPKVTCELRMDPLGDDAHIPFDDWTYGLGRFFGTLSPYRSAVNPAHPGAHHNGNDAALAETSASYSKDTNVFTIQYRQLVGKSPISIKLWLNDASEKTGTAATGHTYRSYTMQRREDQTKPDYTKGVWYVYRLQSGTTDLPAGPHTYYFTADDGDHVARWPVRPDQYITTDPRDNPATVYHFTDAWVPTVSAAFQSANADYVDNDYVPGPYVNSAPKITNVSVTPGTAKEGSRFVYRATYSDADGQRPYQALITIQINDSGATRTFAMVPDPKYKLDPTADNSALYKTGMEMILDTSTIQDFSLAKGVRAYYIKMTDDWGHQYDVNDVREGETTRYLPGEGNWVTGPVISGNTPPTLTNGSVTSSDSTSNSATLWTFSVRYRDMNNDAPAVIKLFIGTLQPTDKIDPAHTAAIKTILWDAGHTMVPSGTSGRAYSDGVDYNFKTRLGGPAGAGSDGIQYYYAFEAYDGVSYATYKNSSKDQERSDAANCFIMQDAIRDAGDPAKFKIAPQIARQIDVNSTSYDSGTLALDPDPGKAGDIVRIFGVYRTEDLERAAATGTPPLNYNYYDSGVGVPPVYVKGTRITLSRDIPLGKAWVKCEVEAPLVGPMPVAPSVPAGVISDPKIYSNFVSSGTPLLVTDQKNGFIDPQDRRIRAVVSMDGVGAYLGRESSGYVLPLDASAIASVDGVYWMDPDTTKNPDPTINYYDPSMLSSPAVREARVVVKVVDPTDHSKDIHLVDFTDPDEVYKVFGVYTDDQMREDDNHFLGADYNLDAYRWQEAWLMSQGGTDTNVIWPTKPNDICTVKGVFASMNLRDPLGNFMIPGDPYVVPATFNAGSGKVTIIPGYNIDGAIRAIKAINEKADMTGADYYTPTDTSGTGDAYSGGPITPTVLPAADATVYVSYTPARDFGSVGEFMALKKTMPVPVGMFALRKVFIAYFAPGDLDANKQLQLTVNVADPTQPVYVKILPKAFNPGDTYIKLTKKLPNLKTAAAYTLSRPTVITPADSTVLADIGDVVHVYIGTDQTVDYYTGTDGPINRFMPGDSEIHLSVPLPDPMPDPKVTIEYIPRQRPVTIQYSDMRFTHQMTGRALQVDSNPPTTPRIGSMTQGTTHFGCDPANSTNILNITGNAPDPVTSDPRDVDGGVVGVWLYSDLTEVNYFNPRWVGRYIDNAPFIRLSNEVPVLTDYLYARAYQKGVYFMDRWNRGIRFDAQNVPAVTDRIQVSYFFGTKMPYLLLPNSMPELSAGSISPLTGSRGAPYVYRVTYKDVDGPHGQAPAYVRVYIDGVPYDMTAASAGTPVYNVGAVYTFTPTGGLAGGSHTYHFEASDGAAISWFDKSGMHKSDRGLIALDVVDLDGPWVNDLPQLSNGAVTPNPVPGGIGTQDPADYTVTVRDPDNDPPYFFDLRDILGSRDVSGSPRVWIDSNVNDDVAKPMIASIFALEAEAGSENDPIESLKKRVIVAKVDDGAGNLVDATWQTDQFAGKLLQISNGDTWSDIYPSPYLRVYLIQSNTASKLVVAADSLEGTNLTPGELGTDPDGKQRYAQFRINGLLMTKVDPTQEDFSRGVNYKISVPRLAVGQHDFHFTLRTRETKPDWLLAMTTYTTKEPYSALVRLPSLGDLPGPNVISVTPDTNRAPVLSTILPSTVYRGPRAQYATVTTPSKAVPSNYLGLQSVVGVGLNANLDAHLPLASQKDYYDTTSVANPPRNPDPVLLAPSLPPVQAPLLQASAKVLDALTVVPTAASAIQAVLGVYLASDTGLADIYPVASADLGAGNKITLTRALPAGVTQVNIRYIPRLVQHATVNDLLTVTPDVPGAIGSVTGVYVAQDTGLLTNYPPVTSALNPDHTISLVGALPTGTTDAFVTYKPRVLEQAGTAVAGSDTVTLAGVDINGVGAVVGIYQASDTDRATNLADTSGWLPGDTTIDLLGGPMVADTSVVIAYVPWPPVYIKYFAPEPISGKKSVHGSFIAGEPLTFKVLYKDADNNPPRFHDGVQGYVRVKFDDTGRQAQLVAMGRATDYVTGVAYGVTLTDVPEGLHAFHFEASDGFVVTSYPDVHESVQVNYKPVLSTGSVDHTSGATTFTFSVMYSDADNVAPGTGGYVKVVLTNEADPTKTQSFTMVADTVKNWVAGVRHTVTADVTSPALPAGTYKAWFVANDGFQDATPIQLAGTITIRVEDPNHQPEIASYSVYKGAGKTTDSFVYRAQYRDEYGDAPVYVSPTGVRSKALTLIIDGGTAAEQRLAMTMDPAPPVTPPAPPLIPDWTGNPDAAHYWPTLSVTVTGKKLGPGNHTYSVIASDGSKSSKFAAGLASVKAGPIMMIPYFDIKVVGKGGEPITDRCIVGQEVLIEGTMLFPYTGNPDEVPAAYTNIEVKVTKPDLTTVALSASLKDLGVLNDENGQPQSRVGTLDIRYSGYVDPALLTQQSLTLMASGQWLVNASWPGNSLYDPAQTDTVVDGRNDQVRVNVSGPSRTMALTDPLKPELDTNTPLAEMITPPMMIGSTTPGGIFGYDRALSMQIFKWSPGSNQYFRYGLSGVFPPIQPGDAVWIKPLLAGDQAFPAPEPLGTNFLVQAVQSSKTVVRVPAGIVASHVRGVYLNAAGTGQNYYDYSTAAVKFKPGDTSVTLTRALPLSTTPTWIDYVSSQSGVDEGWIALDNPAVENVSIDGDPLNLRYFHSSYRLIKVLAKAYPIQTGTTGAPKLDAVTKLPLLSPCTITLGSGWNQFGNIFFNWKKGSQTGTPKVGDLTRVVPSDGSVIGKLLGVYDNAQMTGTNFYQPGLFPMADATRHSYARGQASVDLTTALPAGTTTVYLKYELYPREDVGLPISAVTVTHLGVSKSLTEARAAGWLTDYVWRYDAVGHNYVLVSATAPGAERVLKAWAGYWIRAYVDCQLQIDPNTAFNGVTAAGATAARMSTEATTVSEQGIEMPPPAPGQ